MKSAVALAKGRRVDPGDAEKQLTYVSRQVQVVKDWRWIGSLSELLWAY